MVKFKHWRKQLYRRVIRLQGAPLSVARGFALGVIFGNLMPPGLQLFTGIPVALLLGGNVLAFVTGTCVSNPLTYVAVYVFNCKVGELFLNTLGHADIHIGEDLHAAIVTAGEFSIRHPIQTFAALLNSLRPFLSCWISGGLIVGLAESVPAYYLAYAVVVEVRKLRDFSHARRAARHSARRARAAREGPPAPDEPDEEAEDEQPPPTPT